MWVQSLDQEDPLEEGTATHSSILAWRIPWTGEPGRLQSTGWQSQTRLSDFTLRGREGWLCLGYGVARAGAGGGGVSWGWGKAREGG